MSPPEVSDKQPCVGVNLVPLLFDPCSTNDKGRIALASPPKEDPGDMATTSKPLGLWRGPNIPGETLLYTLLPLS